MIHDNDYDAVFREISEENITILIEAEKELEKINNLQFALGEQETEIDKVLNEVDQALEIALNRDPRDGALIARLKQKQAALRALQQDCIADKATLDASKKKLNQVCGNCSNGRDIIHSREYFVGVRAHGE